MSSHPCQVGEQWLLKHCIKHLDLEGKQEKLFKNRCALFITGFLPPYSPFIFVFAVALVWFLVVVLLGERSVGD